ncbi:hypothetical protein FraQA3DRAFT_6515 [Frankia sp. QA3]|nr:hypothetical protein FraQA3DRAFT_6515 [Frankia sp. QA3]
MVGSVCRGTVPTRSPPAPGKAADEQRADIAPVPQTAGPIAAYPRGTFLRAALWAPIANIRERLRTAIGTVLGPDQVSEEPARFKPRISVTNCNATPGGEPAIASSATRYP